VEIEIYSDVVCPWCYLGTRRLLAAVEEVPADVVLRWRAFQLDPSTPRAAQPLLGWLADRFGGVAAARRETVRVRDVAAAEGLVLDFDRALITNSFDAHRLLWFADQPQAVRFGAFAHTQQELAEATHRAHLTDGLDIGSADVLVDLADQVGLDPDRIRDLLTSGEGTADVRAELARAHSLGIRAVPTLIIEDSFRITGAQPVATLRRALEEVARRLGRGTDDGGDPPSGADPVPGPRAARPGAGARTDGSSVS
jgi:predicted DsbA family dithiol-disulfide isomerase